MVLSLIFIVGFFTLFLLPITFITILFSMQPYSYQNPASTIDDKPQLGSMWRLLFGQVMFSSSNDENGKVENEKDGEERRVARRQEAGEECRVCLCEVEEGDEISDLRCNHTFHKVCLDAWVGSGHATCPLCRGRVFSPVDVADSVGSPELLFFRFTSSVGSRRTSREGNWWIR